MKKFMLTTFAITIFGCSISDPVLGSNPNEDIWGYHAYTQYEIKNTPVNTHVYYMAPILLDSLNPSNILQGFNYPQAVSLTSYSQSKGVRVNGGQISFPLVMHFSSQYHSQLPDLIRNKITQSKTPENNVSMMLCAQNFPWTDKAIVGLRPCFRTSKNIPESGVFEHNQGIEVAVFGSSQFINAQANEFIRAQITVRGDEFEVKPLNDRLHLQLPSANDAFWSYVSYTVDGQPKVDATLHLILTDEQHSVLENALARHAPKIPQYKVEGRYNDFQGAFQPSSGNELQRQYIHREMQEIRSDFLRVISLLAFAGSCGPIEELAPLLNLSQPIITYDTCPWNLESSYNDKSKTIKHKISIPSNALKVTYPGLIIRFKEVDNKLKVMRPSRGIPTFSIPRDNASQIIEVRISKECYDAENGKIFIKFKEKSDRGIDLPPINEGGQIVSTSSLPLITATTFSHVLPNSFPSSSSASTLCFQSLPSNSDVTKSLLGDIIPLLPSSSASSTHSSTSGIAPLALTFGPVELVFPYQEVVSEYYRFRKTGTETPIPYKLTNFSYPEQDYQWNLGKKSSIEVPAIQNGQRVKSIIFRDTGALVTPDYPLQSVDVLLNDKTITSELYEIEQAPRKTIEVPFPYDLTGNAQIVFKTPNPSRLANLGVIGADAQDTREVALAFITAEVVFWKPIVDKYNY